MADRPSTGFVLAAMLLTDAVVGIAFAILVAPAFGAILFLAAAGTSLLAWRAIRSRARRGADGASAPPPADPALREGEDPSYNPYARED